VGSGLYGNRVRDALHAEGIEPFVRLEEENGCCYCLVEPGGERTFLSLHGAEYRFSRSWMTNVDYSQTGGVLSAALRSKIQTAAKLLTLFMSTVNWNFILRPARVS
jgi:sugar/nucleoside kinase (ribokinase family)